MEIPAESPGVHTMHDGRHFQQTRQPNPRYVSPEMRAAALVRAEQELQRQRNATGPSEELPGNGLFHGTRPGPVNSPMTRPPLSLTPPPPSPQPQTAITVAMVMQWVVSVLPSQLDVTGVNKQGRSFIIVLEVKE